MHTGFLCNASGYQAVPALSALSRYYASKPFPPHTVITMPALSPTITAGNIGTWQKGTWRHIGLPAISWVEIETDKAQMDFEFHEEGVLVKVLKESGEKDVPVGNPIAVMVDEGSDPGCRGEACQRLDLEVKGHFRVRKVQPEVWCNRK
jgi:pyruvate dehydrogenase E2 component (dihydrolipoamide acetyltransferase)